MTRRLTALIEREGDRGCFCPSWTLLAKVSSIEQAHNKTHEALELFFESASRGSRLYARLYLERYS